MNYIERIIKQWERADRPLPPPVRPGYHTAQSTIDAYWHLKLYDKSRLEGWLSAHPQDAEFLRALKK